MKEMGSVSYGIRLSFVWLICLNEPERENNSSLHIYQDLEQKEKNQQNQDTA